MTAQERLAEIKARAQAATEGPWEAHICGGATDSTGNTLCEPGTHANGIWSQPEQRDIVRDETGQLTTPDAAFIAHARTDVPALVSALEAVLALNTGDNRRIYGNDFEAGMAKALWLAHQAITEALGGNK